MEYPEGEKHVSSTFPPFLYVFLPVTTVFLTLVWQWKMCGGTGTKKLRQLPGPRGLPIIGNALQLPKSRQWLTWEEWRKSYGDMVYFRILRTPNLILSSYQVASDLMDRRGLKYSDRPRAVMAGELVGWDKGLGYCPGPPNHRFKELRRLFNTFIGPKSCESVALQKIQQTENLKLLMKLIVDPERFMEHTRDSTSSLLLLLSYGYQIDNGDPLDLVTIVEDAMDGFSKASEPGWVVDSFPLLRYIPWMPFQSIANAMKFKLERLYEVPYSFVKQQRADGTARMSFVSSFLDEKGDGETTKYEEIINAAAASLYSGGAETTVSSLNSFILAMALYPDVQSKAQAEIDRYMSQVPASRLPTIQDREYLPYVTSVVKEVYRWNPSVPLGLPHILTEDDIYKGYFIEKGTVVWPNIWSILHDERIFSNPHDFIPERYLGDDGTLSRKDNEISPLTVVDSAFGFGRRICPGMYFAESSIFLSVARMLYVFRITKAINVNGTEIIPDVEYDGFISHPRPFKCQIEPRSRQLKGIVQSEYEIFSV